ncbi:MAG TPA: hypothetical protein DIT25_04505 [Candidatus Moranbacteria bacterium]|nr:hypothetical protein [Candidatus Moranbacteria bacterium]
MLHKYLLYFGQYATILMLTFLTTPMQNELQKELLEAGLNENEAGIYLAALELGETTVSRLARKSGIKRTTAYLVIESLKEKGLISSLKKESASVFFAEDPRKLHEIMEERKQKIDKIMPQLLAFTNLIDRKPEIKFYEGKEGVNEVLKDMLKYPNSEVVGWISEDYVVYFTEDFFINYFIPTRVKKKISVRSISPDTHLMRNIVEKTAPSSIRKVKFIKSEKFNVSIEMNIYGKNKISLLSCEEEIGLIIRSQKIHDSLKSIFEVSWDSLPD